MKLDTEISKTPATNSHLAQWRLTWLIEHLTKQQAVSMSHQSLNIAGWFIDSFAPTQYAKNMPDIRYVDEPQTKSF